MLQTMHVGKKFVYTNVQTILRYLYIHIYIYINIYLIYIYIYLYTYMQDMHSWLKFRSWQHCRICKRHLCHCWFQAPAMHVLRLQRQMFRKQTLRIGHCQPNISCQCCASHDCYHWRSRSAKQDARTLNACAAKNRPIAILCVTIWFSYISFLDVQKKDCSARSVLAGKVEVQWCQWCLPTTISEHCDNRMLPRKQVNLSH